MNLQPEQQQQAGPGEVQIPAVTTTPEAVPAPGAWQSSGSIGPFFAVISVLTILSVLSCYLGRKWNPRSLTPLESIENDSRSCFGWLKLFRRPCIPTPVQVKNVNKPPEILPTSANNKHSDDDCTVEDGEVIIAAQNLHPQA
ncbi:hypothetical protein QN277_006904 [Acacia crassicarpa]|uniref:Uncharacterized protein n=1 Tax=Acacia crassicarpa TaxID=499986 RepID=A0AAE1JTE7_9FABA|nr:hypothetical protein QN277_006904 [Acacia crassicarpa]